MMNAANLALLDAGKCPDCQGSDLVLGPRGGLGQNTACRGCGAEFNVVRHVIDHGVPKGPVILAHRNSARDGPNRLRLATVFQIFLADPTPEFLSREAAAAAYFDPRCAERECDGCGESYRGPSVYCSLRCTLADA
jgi:hypothetical protein